MTTRLSRKRQAFIEEYLVDQNGTQAAIRAGYKESNAASTACNLLKIPIITDIIKERLGLKAMEADEALELLGKMARKAKSENVQVRALESVLKVHQLTKDTVVLEGDIKIKVNLIDE